MVWKHTSNPSDTNSNFGLMALASTLNTRTPEEPGHDGLIDVRNVGPSPDLIQVKAFALVATPGTTRALAASAVLGPSSLDPRQFSARR